MEKRIMMVLIVLVVLWVGIHRSVAGTVIEQQVKDREERATQVTLYFSENQLRTDHPESGLTTILDFKIDQIILIDHRSKNFLSMKFSQWEKETAKQLKKSNPSVQPKERIITVRNFGETATINGFKTEKVQVLADGELIEEHSMTKDINMNDVDQVLEKAAQGFSKELGSELKEGREIHQKLKSYGFSILVKDYAVTSGGKAVDILEVKKIERKELNKETFLPPAGYERVVPPPVKK
jgi:hypothetical protein